MQGIKIYTILASFLYLVVFLLKRKFRLQIRLQLMQVMLNLQRKK